MPVLKFLEVISRIAVPVVSDPVPAVVGTIHKVGQRPRLHDTGDFTGNQGPKILGDR